MALNAGGTLVAAFTVPAIACREYISLAYPLDSSGQWLLPDFTSKLGDLTGVQPSDPWQANANGTVFTGPQTAVMEVGGHDGATPYTTSRLVITLMDVTPPAVAYQIQGNGQSGLDSPSGMKYFIAPVDLSLSWSATDNVDGVIASAYADIEVDCVIIEELAPMHITDPGLYTLRGKFRDVAGNSTTVSQVFEVRSHYNYTAKSAVDSITITPDGQLDFVEAHVLLTGAPIPTCLMAPSTIAVWILDQHGEPIGDSPLRAAPDTVVNGIYNSTRINFDLCVMRLAVQGYVPGGSLLENTVRFEVTGSGSHGTTEEFDFISVRQPFVAQANARQALSAFAPAPNCDCDTPPGPPPCTWKSQLIPDQPDSYSLWETGLCGGRAISMTADSTHIHGTASATDNCWYAYVNASISHSVGSGGTLKVFLEPQSCCTECSISIIARPKFKAAASIDPPASAAAGAYISVASPCGNANAQGGVAIGDYSTPYVEIFGVPIPVGQGDQTGTQVFQDNLRCVEHSCSVNISISTGAYLAVNAHSTIQNWIAEAKANIFGSDVGLTVTPTAIPNCNVTNNGTPFEIRRCPGPVPLP